VSLSTSLLDCDARALVDLAARLDRHAADCDTRGAVALQAAAIHLRRAASELSDVARRTEVRT
jgi:hypothetical protein